MEKPKHISQVPEELTYDHYSESLWAADPERRMWPREEGDALADENIAQAEVDKALEEIFEPPTNDGKPHAIDK